VSKIPQIPIDTAPHSAYDTTTGRAPKPTRPQPGAYTFDTAWLRAKKSSEAGCQAQSGVSHGVSNVEEIRPFFRRLVRRARRTQAQIIPHPQARTHLPRKAAPTRHNKKSPPLDDIGRIVAAWAELRPSKISVGRHFARICGAIGVAEIGPKEIARVVSYFRLKSRTTLHSYSIQLKGLLRFIEKIGGPKELASLVPKCAMPVQRAIIARPDEVDRILQNANLGLRLHVLLCLDCALRAAESMSAGPHNYNQAEKQLTLRIKGGRTVTIPVTDRIATILEAALQVTPPGESFVFTLAGPHSRFGMQAQWRALKKKTGVRKELHFHDLRRTTATRAYEATKDLRTVQQLLSHSSLMSTIRYIAPLDPQKLKPLIEAIRIPEGRRIQ